MDLGSADQTSIGIVFDRLAVAFATFDAANMADLFAAPAVTVAADGALAARSASGDGVPALQAALDGYRRDGAHTCHWSDLTLTPMGRHALLATVTWHMLRHDTSEAARWRQSYGLTQTADGPRIVMTVVHAP